MKTRIAVLRTAVVVVAMMLAMTAGATLIGPGEKPDWESSAQVRLGWAFEDPTKPVERDRLTEEPWDRWIGDEPPAWNYTFEDLNGESAHFWEITVPNVPNQDNPYKRFWLSLVYEHVPPGDYGFIMPTDPPTEREMVLRSVEQVELGGTTYTQHTLGYRLEPNPFSETIRFSLRDVAGQDGPYLHEAYVLTECVPEPATMTVLGIGLAGFAVRRFRHHLHI